MKKYLFLLIFASMVFGHTLYAEINETTGFVPGQIWYSKDSLVEGDTVKIYTALWNGEESPLQAHVEFYDKNVILGARDVVLEKSTLKDVSVSWKITAGDHVISAKITTSTVTNGAKKEQVVLDRTVTSEDKQFVPVSVKKADGTPVSNAGVVKDQLDQASKSVENLVPSSVREPVSNTFGSLDSVRDTTYDKITASKNETKKKIDTLNSKPIKPTSVESKPLDATEKPIAYIKLFLLSVLGFIFGYKIVFYGILLVLLFLIGRYIYLSIRKRN